MCAVKSHKYEKLYSLGLYLCTLITSSDFWFSSCMSKSYDAPGLVAPSQRQYANYNCHFSMVHVFVMSRGFLNSVWAWMSGCTWVVWWHWHPKLCTLEGTHAEQTKNNLVFPLEFRTSNDSGNMLVPRESWSSVSLDGALKLNEDILKPMYTA